ncbi:MAG: N-acetyltransferase, partial [Rhodococcus sp. (in: high G+C Gram-positive bacteria)]
MTLDVLRRAYGRSMRPLTAAGSYLDGDGWWAGITGAPDPDYNLALVHNGDVTAHAQHVYDIVTAARFPAIVLLAGRGLAAAQVLVDRGWVCAGALDLTVFVPVLAPEDDALRVLVREDMSDARDLAAGAFGVSPGT